ncbi:MAG: Asp23/Gls24 family envelope stress response protein [Tissierellia bacterium]|nr:Asp23/Gls24 family envelope stress response protein [Tissierellia bacterium]
MEQQKFKKGRVRISNDIIKLIACEAAMDIDGVTHLITENGTAMDKIDDNAMKSVDMQIIRNTVILDINIGVDYNSRINIVARNVQKNIKDKIEIMTGLHVTTVNINVLELEQ